MSLRAANKAAAPNAKRKPLQHVEFDTSESDRGAWAEGKPLLALVTEFLGLVMAEDYDAAFTLSEQILKREPDNEIIQRYQPVLQAKIKLFNEAAEGEDEEEEEEEEEEDEGDDDDDDADDEDEDDGKKSDDNDVSESKSLMAAAADVTCWHGSLADPTWQLPRLAAGSEEAARPGYDCMSASEYVERPETMRAKVKVLAALLRRADNAVVYTGAGISTASGTPDYASKAAGSRAPHLHGDGGRQPQRSIGRGSRLEARPTYAHHALAALQRKGYVAHWLQQNHDRLAQKAGFPQARLNEIHGAWGDDKNRVLMMDEELRPDLLAWMEAWEARADLCVAMGTSLCGMAADCVAEACARRAAAAAAAAETETETGGGGGPATGVGSMQQGGLVIINLQRTKLDGSSSLRIFGALDDVMRLLVLELLGGGSASVQAKQKKKKAAALVPNRTCAQRGAAWEREHPRCFYRTPKRTATSPM